MARQKRISGFRFFIKLIFWPIILFLIIYLAMFVYQLFLELTLPKAKGEAQAIVVLGAQVKEDGNLSVQLEWRLQKALEAYKEKPRYIVVTGGQGKDEPVPEAQAMYDWLVAQGVPAEHILQEKSSVNTKENIKKSLEMLPPDTSIAIVTSDYHLPRAIRIAKDYGVSEVEGIPSPIKPEFWLKNHAREALAWGKYFLEKIL
jgi:SanA protein